MKNSYISLIILSTLCLLASCSRENEQAGPAAQRISFSASARATEAHMPLTKTAYGTVSGSTQAINWSNGDRLSIYCPHAVIYSDGGTLAAPAASYTVSVGESTTVAPVSEEYPLMWGLTPSHVFVGKYPDPAWETGSGTPYAYEPFRSQSATSMDFLCYLPATQALTLSSGATYLPEMKYCYMAAYGTAATGSSNVALTFTPCVSAFEIVIPNAYATDDFTVKKVELISATQRLNGEFTVHLADQYSFTEISPRTVTLPSGDLTEADRTVTVDFGAGITVTSAQELRFTVFTCPVALNDLTLRVTLASDDIQTLELRESNSGSWLEFAAFKKYLITCGTVPDPYTYDISTDVTAVTTSGAGSSTGGSATVRVTSTKTKLGSATGASWKAQYSADGSTGWTDFTSPTAGITLSKYTGTGDPAGEDVTVTLAAGSSSSGSGSISYDFLTAPTDNSTKAGAIDLSLYNFLDNTVESTYETANCYVIRAPGWYKFPLVYGNAVKGETASTVNTGSFTCGVEAGSRSSDYRYIGVGGDCNFVDGKGTAITSLKYQISDATTVGISWQDAANEVITRSGDNAYCIDDNYVFFYVPADKIQPGNVVLKVTDGSTTIWSWHIWMVPSNLDSTIAGDTSLQLGVKAVTNYQSVVHNMLTLNLGQLPPTSGTRTGYAAGTYYIRFVSSATGVSAQTDAVTVTRPFSGGGAITNPQGKYACPVYQWGRKDPMLTNSAGTSKTDRTKIAWGTDITSPATQYRGDDNFSKNSSAVSALATAVANPATFYGNGSGINSCWYTNAVASKALANMWDTTQAGANANESPNAPVKSVYDPSPRGFRVAGKNDFTGFTTTGENTSTSGEFNVLNSTRFSTDYGWKFKCNSSDDQGIFFPASGRRDSSNGNLYNVGGSGYHWSSSSYDAYNGGSLYFDSGYVYPLLGYYRAGGFAVRSVRM